MMADEDKKSCLSLYFLPQFNFHHVINRASRRSRLLFNFVPSVFVQSASLKLTICPFILRLQSPCDHLGTKQQQQQWWWLELMVKAIAFTRTKRHTLRVPLFVMAMAGTYTVNELLVILKLPKPWPCLFNENHNEFVQELSYNVGDTSPYSLVSIVWMLMRLYRIKTFGLLIDCTLLQKVSYGDP